MTRNLSNNLEIEILQFSLVIMVYKAQRHF